MEIQAGNQTAPSYAQPELWAFLDGLWEQDRPVFMRGDSHWGTEKAMLGAEALGYVFKLKQSYLIISPAGFRRHAGFRAPQERSKLISAIIQRIFSANPAGRP
jgi:hypothetical protein